MFVFRIDWTRDQLEAVRAAAFASFIRHSAGMRAIVARMYADSSLPAVARPRAEAVCPDAYLPPTGMGWASPCHLRPWVPLR